MQIDRQPQREDLMLTELGWAPMLLSALVRLLVICYHDFKISDQGGSCLRTGLTGNEQPSTSA
jgi:hypothetical protein